MALQYFNSDFNRVKYAVSSFFNGFEWCTSLSAKEFLFG